MPPQNSEILLLVLIQMGRITKNDKAGERNYTARIRRNISAHQEPRKITQSRTVVYFVLTSCLLVGEKFLARSDRCNTVRRSSNMNVCAGC